MMNRQQQITDFTFEKEGLYQCSRGDGGNWTGGTQGQGRLVGTKYGISAPVLAASRKNDKITPDDMRLLGKAEAEAIAVEQYWKPMRCQDFPAGVDAMVFDYGYNAGCTASIKILQQVVGVTVDGIIGERTLVAVNSVTVEALAAFLSSQTITVFQKSINLPESGTLNGETLKAFHVFNMRLEVFCAALAEMQISKYRKMKDFPRFGKGWLERAKARFLFACKLIALPAITPQNAAFS